jgi:hypothetical protein
VAPIYDISYTPPVLWQRPSTHPALGPAAVPSRPSGRCACTCIRFLHHHHHHHQQPPFYLFNYPRPHLSPPTFALSLPPSTIICCLQLWLLHSLSCSRSSRKSSLTPVIRFIAVLFPAPLHPLALTLAPDSPAKRLAAKPSNYLPSDIHTRSTIQDDIAVRGSDDVA